MRRLLFACLVILPLLCGCAAPAYLPTRPDTPNPFDMLLAAAPTATPRPSPTPQPTPAAEITAEPAPDPNLPPEGAFSAGDVQVTGLALFSDVDKALARLGEPLLREENVYEASGEIYATLAYDGLFLHMSGGRLMTRATITSGDWMGPRGAQLGQSLKEVLALFSLEIPEEREDGSVLYARRLPGEDTPYPPLCAIDFDENENGEYMARMLCPLDPYDDEALRSGEYLFSRHAVLLLYFDAEDKLVRLSLQAGPLVE